MYVCVFVYSWSAVRSWVIWWKSLIQHLPCLSTYVLTYQQRYITAVWTQYPELCTFHHHYMILITDKIPLHRAQFVLPLLMGVVCIRNLSLLMLGCNAKVALSYGLDRLWDSLSNKMTRWHILHYRLCNWLITIYTGGVEGSGYCSPAMSLYNYDFPVNFYFIWPVFFFWWLLQLWPCLQGNVKENRGGLLKPIYLQAGRLQGTVDWDWFGSKHQTSLSRSATVPFQWILHVRGTVCCHPSGMRRCWWRSIVTWILCIMLNNNNNKSHRCNMPWVLVFTA